MANLEQLAAILGYESIRWDAGNECYSGYGSSDPLDRSRDDATNGYYIANDDTELAVISERAGLRLRGRNPK